jgi:CheY-like chemotaxis protein
VRLQFGTLPPVQTDLQGDQEEVRTMRQKTILCIDDDKSILTICKFIFEDLGYRVLVTTSGDAGLEVFRRDCIDGVVLDYRMPGKTGGEVAREMKRLRPSVPIVLFSSITRLPDEIRPFINAFVEKGAHSEALTSTIDSVFDGLTEA